MMHMLGPLIRACARFRRDEHGAVLAETLIVVPFVTLFSVGILEFGNMFWQKEQIETGLRDAARYLARCQTNVSLPQPAITATARSIAFYGTPSPGVGAALRVPGWGPAAADITITQPVAGVIRVAATHGYQSSPLFGWLDLAAISIEAFHEERYIGW